MLNPCCCISPRIGTFVFAILDVLMAVSYAWAVLSRMFDVGLSTGLILELVMSILLLCMGGLLLLGAIYNSAEKIRLWLILWIVYLILALVFQVFNIWSNHQIGARTGSSIGGYLLLCYQIWVVYAYLVELRCGPAGLQYCPTQITV